MKEIYLENIAVFRLKDATAIEWGKLSAIAKFTRLGDVFSDVIEDHASR